MIDLSAQDFRDILERSYRQALEASAQSPHGKPSQSSSETVNDESAVPAAIGGVGTEQAS